MTRIAYLVSDYDAPSHTFVRREVAALRALGSDVIAFSIQANRKLDSEAIHILGRPPSFYLMNFLTSLVSRPRAFLVTWYLALQHRPPGLRAIIWSHFHFMEAIVLARFLSDARIRHLHVHFANSGATVAMLAAKFAHIPWSLTLHGISETDYPAGLLLPDKIARAHFVACASYFMQAQAMRQISPHLWPKLRIVRCGVDSRRLEQFAVERQSQGVPSLVCVGRLSPEKNHIGLLEAISNLRRRGVGCRLTLVGDGPVRAIIEKIIEDSDLFDAVSLVGFLDEDDTLDVIASSDILVLPSFMEGLPVVLIEALAMGKPVIASRVAGIPELIEHGKSGILFTPACVIELEDALFEVLSDPSKWREMGAEGKARVRAQFDSFKVAKELRELFLIGT